MALHLAADHGAVGDYISAWRGTVSKRRVRYMLVCVDAPALHAFCVYIGTETRDFAWIRAPMHVSTKTHVSEFLAVTHMILKSDLRK